MESLDESYLVKGIESFILGLVTRYASENEKIKKLRQMRCLTLLLNLYLKGGHSTEAILPIYSIEAMKLGENMQTIAASEQEKMIVGRLALAIMAIKTEVTVTQLFGDS